MSHTLYKRAGARLNTQHPLAQGLIFFALPGADRPDELLTSVKGTLVGTNHVWNGLTLHGRAGDDNGAAGGVYWPFRLAMRSTVNLTVIARLNMSAVEHDGNLVVVPYSNAWNNPWSALDFTLSPDSGTTKGHLHLTSGGSFSSVDSDASFYTTGVDETYGVTRNGTTITFFRNGAQHGTTKTLGFSGAIDTGSQFEVSVGMSASYRNADNVGGKKYVYAIYTRALLAGEMAMFHFEALTGFKNLLIYEENGFGLGEFGPGGASIAAGPLVNSVLVKSLVGRTLTS